MSELYNTRQVAKRMGIAERTVRKWCKIFNMTKFDGYVLTEEDVEKIRSIAKNKPGRPPK